VPLVAAVEAVAVAAAVLPVARVVAAGVAVSSFHKPSPSERRARRASSTTRTGADSSAISRVCLFFESGGSSLTFDRSRVN
jgi:hypothetical protein